MWCYTVKCYGQLYGGFNTFLWSTAIHCNTALHCIADFSFESLLMNSSLFSTFMCPLPSLRGVIGVSKMNPLALGFLVTYKYFWTYQNKQSTTLKPPYNSQTSVVFQLGDNCSLDRDTKTETFDENTFQTDKIKFGSVWFTSLGQKNKWFGAVSCIL